MGYRKYFGENDVVQEYIEVLEKWDCSTFMKEVSSDTDIEQLIHKIVDTFKRIIGKYNQVENSPDGVQAIILYDDFRRFQPPFRNLFLDALLNAKITNAKSDFISSIDGPLFTEAAMRKCYKMIQISNAFLPPTILDKDNLSLYPNLIEHGWRENSLLQPNSFYVQAYVYEKHINFILNKVVAVSSIGNAVQKSTFTIQETSIKVDNISDTICDIMWNHFQVLDFEEYGNRLFQNCCDKHGFVEFNSESYFNFKANLKILIRNWVGNIQKDTI